MSNQVEVRSAGVGLPTLLTLLFVGLKLTDHIDWSWFWVLSPLWISFSFGILFLVVLAALYFIARKF